MIATALPDFRQKDLEKDDRITGSQLADEIGSVLTERGMSPNRSSYDTGWRQAVRGVPIAVSHLRVEDNSRSVVTLRHSQEVACRCSS